MIDSWVPSNIFIVFYSRFYLYFVNYSRAYELTRGIMRNEPIEVASLFIVKFNNVNECNKIILPIYLESFPFVAVCSSLGTELARGEYRLRKTHSRTSGMYSNPHSFRTTCLLYNYRGMNLPLRRQRLQDPVIETTI